MTERSFVDSNVLVYIDDHSAPEKQARATEIYDALRRTEQGVISTQVLQEYYAVAVRKLRMEPRIARGKLELFMRFEIVQVEPALTFAAIDLHQLHQLSFWDALIVQAAQAANCRVLYSQDLQAGRRFGAVEVVNPFAG